MFSIRIWDDNNNATYTISIKLNNFDKNVAYKLKDKELNEAITTFILHFVLQHVGLSWIIENKNKPKFDIEEHYDQWIQNVPLYNATTSLQ